MKKPIILSVVLFVLSVHLIQAQQTAHEIILEKMNYLLYLPEDYATDTVKQFPLMVFLHGVGECGDDVEKVKWLGPPRKIADGYKYPFIVVSPQAAQRGWRPDNVRRLILDLQKTYRIDEDRIYLTGLSMGGFGTWLTAKSFPELFAAIVPICGGDMGNDMNRLRNMPVWCFHGAKDESVNISNSQTAIDSLRKYTLADVRFTIYPEAGHDSWTETYNNEEVYQWLLSHKRFKYTEKTISKKQLKEYEGEYENENDIKWHNSDIKGVERITLLAANGELLAKREFIHPEHQSTSEITYKFAGNDTFFAVFEDPTRDSKQTQSIEFVRDKNTNQIIGYNLYYNYSNKMRFYKKLK